MKKSKLSLEALQVKSFVTSVKEHKLKTIKGGSGNIECYISDVVDIGTYDFSPYLANIDPTLETLVPIPTEERIT